MRAGGALGRLLPCPLLPCPLLPWPLLPAAAAALVDGPPPAPLLPALALPLPFFCGAPHAPSTSGSERRGARSPVRQKRRIAHHTQLHAVRSPMRGEGGATLTFS
jgi:hypothetical protein